MSFFRTAYDTTVGQGYPVGKIKAAINESIVRDMIQHVTELRDPITNGLFGSYVSGFYQSEANIPFFLHPLYLESEIKDENYLFVDIRSVITKHGTQFFDNDAYRIRNKMEYDLLRSRLILNYIWLTKRPQMLRDISFVCAGVYSSWISEGISRRFALDPLDQLKITVLSAIFYYTLFMDRPNFDDDEYNWVVGAVMKATKAPSKLVMEILDAVKGFKNLKDFCEKIKEVLDNPRLQDLNEGLMISILGTSWFGTGSKEILGVSLEHPPTWIAVLYSAFVDRSYKNAVISKIAERYSGSKGGADFIRSCVSIFESTLVEQTPS